MKGSLLIVGVELGEDGEAWIESFVAGGIEEVEALLAKHAAFLDYLAERGDDG